MSVGQRDLRQAVAEVVAEQRVHGEQEAGHSRTAGLVGDEVQREPRRVAHDGAEGQVAQARALEHRILTRTPTASAPRPGA